MSTLQNAINANASTPLKSVEGGTGLSSPTAHGILVAEGSSAVNPIVLSAGQVLIGTTSGDPSAATISGTANKVTVTSASGSITATLPSNIEVAGLLDTNANLYLSSTANSGSVNYVNVANAATTNPVTISAAGSDTNIGINLMPKGSGLVDLNNSSDVAQCSGFVDTNENKWIVTSSTPSAVNSLYVLNSATGAPVGVSVLGSDTNIGLSLQTKGNVGWVEIMGQGGAGNTSQAELRLFNTVSGAASNYSGFKASGSLTGSQTWTLPLADGSSNQFLQTNGSGTLTFATPSASSLTGQVPLANGGTNANLTASNGGIFYSTSSAGAILSGTATANQLLLSGASGAPAWSTVTHPATTTANQLLYSSSNNTLAGLSTANNGVLVTGSGGAPSISTTLPSGIAATNMSLTTPTLGAATATSVTFSPTTGGIVGTTTNDNASTGYVGEFKSSAVLQASSVTMTSSTNSNLTTLSLTAGDWDVWGMVFFNTGGLISAAYSWVSTSSATQPDESALSGIYFSGSSLGNIGIPSFVQRISLSATTTVYLSYICVFTVSGTACGNIYARRVR